MLVFNSDKNEKWKLYKKEQSLHWMDPRKGGAFLLCLWAAALDLKDTSVPNGMGHSGHKLSIVIEIIDMEREESQECHEAHKNAFRSRAAQAVHGKGATRVVSTPSELYAFDSLIVDLKAPALTAKEDNDKAPRFGDMFEKTVPSLVPARVWRHLPQVC